MEEDVFKGEKRLEKGGWFYPESSRKFNLDDIRLFKYWGIGKKSFIHRNGKYQEKVGEKTKTCIFNYINDIAFQP